MPEARRDGSLLNARRRSHSGMVTGMNPVDRNAAMATEDTAAPTPLDSGARYLALAAMVFATGMTFIDMTIVSIGAPVIESDLGISDESVQWVVNGYLLGLAATFALMGRLADVYGHRRMVIIGTLVFAFSSLMCGLTPNSNIAAGWLIGWRVVEGVGAAMLFPAALAIVVASFPARERGRALALFFAVTGGLTALGPILGGYLVDWDWRSIFWVNIPVAIVALILTAACKVSIARKDEPIDWPGAAIIVVGMGLSVLGFQQAGTWGWSSPATLACIIGGLLVLVLFARFEIGRDYPLIKLRIFADRAFQADNGVLFFMSMAFVPVFFFLSFYAQAALGYSAQNAGYFLMWYFIGFVIASQVGGALLDRIGSKLPMALGGIVGAIGYAGWAFQATSLNASQVIPWIAVGGAGVGLMLGPASTDAVNRAIDATYGEVTGITQTVRNYASALGMAILGSIMTAQIASKIQISAEQSGLNQQQAETLISSAGNQASGGAPGAVANIPSAAATQFLSAVQGDFASAISLVVYAMALLLLLAAISAVRHPGGLSVAAEGDREAAAHEGADQGSPTKQIIKRVLIFVAIFAAIYAVIYFIG